MMCTFFRPARSSTVLRSIINCCWSEKDHLLRWQRSGGDLENPRWFRKGKEKKTANQKPPRRKKGKRGEAICHTHAEEADFCHEIIPSAASGYMKGTEEEGFIFTQLRA